KSAVQSIRKFGGRSGQWFNAKFARYRSKYEQQTAACGRALAASTANCANPADVQSNRSAAICGIASISSDSAGYGGIVVLGPFILRTCFTIYLGPTVQ